MGSSTSAVGREGLNRRFLRLKPVFRSGSLKFYPVNPCHELEHEKALTTFKWLLEVLLHFQGGGSAVTFSPERNER
jgi:hypothetical protein